MKRKTIKQGSNALTITLPQTWVKKQKINPGSEIEVKEEGNNLIISSEVKNEYKSIDINIEGLSNILIWRKLSGAYRAGYDEIKIHFKNSKNKVVYSAFTYDTLFSSNSKTSKLDAIEIIQAHVNRSIGTEIIEQGSTYCIVKDMNEISEKEFENAMRRIFLLILNMIEKIVLGINENDKEELKSIHIIDTNLDRFEDFCIRVLNKKGYKEELKQSEIQQTIFFLEMVGDRYKRLALSLLKTKSISKNTKELLIKTNSFFRKYYQLFYDYSDDKTEDVLKLKEEIKDLFEKISKQTSFEEFEIIQETMSVHRIVSSMTEIRIDMEFL